VAHARNAHDPPRATIPVALARLTGAFLSLYQFVAGSLRSLSVRATLVKFGRRPAATAAPHYAPARNQLLARIRA